MELCDLRLISEGYDPEIVSTLSELNETVGFGKSGKKANKLVYSADTKKAKALLRSGKAACKKDPDAAIKDFEEALKVLNRLKEQANNIEDDDEAARTIYALIWCFLIPIGWVHMAKTSANLDIALKDKDFARKVVYDYNKGEVVKSKEKDMTIDLSDGTSGRVREQTAGLSRGNAVGYFDKLIRKVHECIALAKERRAELANK